MNKLKSLISLVALMFVTSAWAVDATTGPNSVYVEQIGNTNTVTIEQVGGTNTVGGTGGSATVDNTGLTTLTVTAITQGTIGASQSLFGLGVTNETVITGQLTGSTGGAGTYSVNNTQTVASTSMNSAASAAIFTGYMSGTTLTVTGVTSGTLYPGLTITGTGVAANTIITALGNSVVLSGSI